MENDLSKDIIKNKRLDKAVETAAQLFLERGIDDVKMTDIADKSEIGVATLYRYFGTKTSIAISAMTYLWNDLRKMFSGVFESDVFIKQSGLKQITDLMRMFVVLHEAHPAFMKLLGEFDLLMLRERIPKDELKEYERSMIDFYPFIEKAFMTGIADGTIRDDIDFNLLLTTYTHALMQLSEKLLRGEILPSDDFSNGVREIEALIESAAYFIKKTES